MSLASGSPLLNDFSSFYQSNLLQVWNFTNQYIEQDEVIRLPLYEYFSGQMIEFSLEFNLLNDDSKQIFDNKFMYLSEPYKLLNSTLINSQEISNHIEPFLRSTISSVDNDTGNKVIYFLDRDFYFRKHDLSHFSQGEINEVYNIKLNLTFINQNCQDLVQISSNSSQFILLCQRVDINENDTSNPNANKYSNTLQHEVLVLIELQPLNNTPIFKYISYDHNIGTSIDLVVGLRPFYSQYDAYFFANVLSKSAKSDVIQTQPSIVTLNMSLFDKVEPFQMMIMTGSQSPFIQKCKFDIKKSIPKEFSNIYNKILDFTIFDNRVSMFAFIVDPIGLVIQYSDETSLMKEQETCYEDNSPTYVDLSNAVGLFFNSLLPDYLFVAVSFPAGIYEFAISDPFNIYVYKYYGIQQGLQRYVGSNVMTTNADYIVHLLIDIIEYQSVLRIYCRNSTHNSVAKYQFVLPQGSRTNFFQFPSIYLDIIWFRDERQVNISVFGQQELILNSTKQKDYQLYMKKTFNVTINAQNSDSYCIGRSFNVSFLEENNTQVFSVYQKQLQNNNYNIFYNCGEDDFNYILTDFFNGPNYNLAIQSHYANGSTNSSFYLSNEQFIQQQTKSSNFNLSQCYYNFLYNQLYQDTKMTLLLCIPLEGNQVMSFSLYSNDDSPTNTIYIPESNFVNAAFDPSTSILLALSQVTNQEWDDTNIEFHFFTIDDDIVIWKSSQEVDVYNFSQIIGFDYNEKAKKGLIFSVLHDSTVQDVYYFNIDTSNYTVSQIYSGQIAVSNKEQLVKSQISDLGFIFSLYSNNLLVIYEIVPTKSGNLINEVKRYNFTTEQYQYTQIRSFDLICSKFLVLYNGSAQIYVFTIDNSIYLNYKMKLPFYSQYSNVTFYNTQIGVSMLPYDRIVRSYNNDVLAILMYENNSVTHKQETRLFLFYLVTSQHDTFVMVKDFTEYFSNSQQNIIHLIENYGFLDTISLINGKNISIYDLQYYNYLVASKDEKLINLCRDKIVAPEVEGGPLIDKGGWIDTQVVLANSNFKLIQGSQEDIQDQKMTFNFVSQNQGQIITPIYGDQSINVSYDVNNNDDSTESMVFLLESVVQGFNMVYETDCTFLNYSSGNISKCNEGVVDQTISTPYQFLIEFVTSEKKVYNAFQLYGFYFMFDDTTNVKSNMLNIFYTKDYYGDLDLYNGYPLIQITSLDQKMLFGCNISEFVDIQEITTIPENKDKNQTFQVYYVMVYQCKVNMKNRHVKLAIIKIEKSGLTCETSPVISHESTSNVSYNGYTINITTLKGGIKQGYPILDAKLVLKDDSLGLDGFQINNTSNYSGKLLMTYNNIGSYSNEISLYRIDINYNEHSFTYENIVDINACTLEVDTFYVNKITIIPNSQLAIIVAEDFGAYFFDLNSAQIVNWICLVEYDSFYLQNLQTQGPFKIFKAIGDWPFCVHFITNYGIFLFDFPVDLQNRTLMDADLEANFVPQNYRIIRNDFDNFKYEVVSNQWGYAFLIRVQNSSESFETYLGSVSFYSSSNTKLFKMLRVMRNQDCFALNLQEQSSEDNGVEDELSVTFVCGTLLIRRGVCLRPHLEIDMTQYSNQAANINSYSALQKEGGQLSYNQYNISIVASNCFDANYHIIDGVGCFPQNISVILNVENTNESTNQIYYVCLIIMVALAFLGLMLLNNKAKQPIMASFDATLSNNDIMSDSAGRKSTSNTISTGERNQSIRQYWSASNEKPRKGLDLRKTKVEFFSEGFAGAGEISGIMDTRGDSDYNKRGVTFKSDGSEAEDLLPPSK